jgi:hypothetical protein
MIFFKLEKLTLQFGWFYAHIYLKMIDLMMEI